MRLEFFALFMACHGILALMPCDLRQQPHRIQKRMARPDWGAPIRARPPPVFVPGPPPPPPPPGVAVYGHRTSGIDLDTPLLGTR